MSRIKFSQIDSKTLEVAISEETPLDIVEQLNKSLISKGMTQDITNSTLSIRRYSFYSTSKAEDIADRLIKSLVNLTKDDTALSPMEQRRKMMAEAQGVEYVPNKVVPKVNQTFTGRTSIPEKPDQTNVDRMNQLKKPAANILPKKAASDDSQHDVQKSSYGPKGAELYSQADNARRKVKNVGDIAGQGPNKNVKSYSSKPGQLSAKAQASNLIREQGKLNRKQPVKILSQEEKDELAIKMGLKKSWINHNAIPNADKEVIKVDTVQKAIISESALANQLANLMDNKSMLGQSYRQPTSEEMIAAGESMGLASSNDVINKAEDRWNNSFNNWLVEASKPISQRFSSPEEEQLYWNSIGIEDRDDGRSGY